MSDKDYTVARKGYSYYEEPWCDGGCSLRREGEQETMSLECAFRELVKLKTYIQSLEQQLEAGKRGEDFGKRLLESSGADPKEQQVNEPLRFEDYIFKRDNLDPKEWKGALGKNDEGEYLSPSVRTIHKDYMAGFKAGQAQGWFSVDELAQIIRIIDGNNSMSAAALAEEILNHLPPLPNPEGE